MSAEDLTSVEREVSPAEPRTRLSLGRLVSTVAVGNLLEWYDFGVYGYFALVIARQFFAGGQSTALLLTFASFGVGFLARPLGAIVFGHVGDRGGRRKALTYSVLGMGVATFLIGCAPTYHQIGLAAPVLLTVLRLLQGFASGGEWAGSATYMLESSPPGRRGFATSWQLSSVALSLTLSASVAALINAVMPASAVESWGWRLPFLAGALIVIPAWILRRSAPETSAFETLKANEQVATAPLREAFRTARRPMLKAVGLVALMGVAYYILLTYLATWLVTWAGFSPALANLTMAIESAALAVATPIFGALSDRIGRKPPMLTACALFAVVSYPVFLLLQNSPAWGVMLLLLVCVVLLGMAVGPATAALAELFPAQVRYTALSIPYHSTTAIFGGFAPFIAAFLVTWTHDGSAPAWYLVAAAVFGFVAVLTFKETARQPLA
ncbi:MFS transporter [Amycolatopsis pithecellobii]|uniref:MFS transporter n=1 Tax=Amycolatopsis pithecellobii TaxID=664692 RepID=A0A6N7Z150_9PSEU|nr:MFS transporter [Amycolatopsis pithecellobii]MTD53234.1 MFS transporter [Amycolatopsis pithecellobii]